ncbi:MAG TPA: hypothetical protein VLW75_08150 [Rhizomicrobium sp.]|nr:hypothetical protein [Rhizomicrobium sp.]
MNGIATAVAGRDDPRVVILLGALLAGLQFLVPIVGLIAAILASALICLCRKGESVGRLAGLVVLVLFMPAVAALAQAWSLL